MAEMPIDVDRLRRTFEDDSVLTELYAMYVQDTGQRLVELREAVAAGDEYRVRRTGHLLKGSSANIGAGTMRDVAAKLESSDLASDGAASTLASALEREFARVERFVNEFIDRAQTNA